MSRQAVTAMDPNTKEGYPSVNVSDRNDHDTVALDCTMLEFALAHRKRLIRWLRLFHLDTVPEGSIMTLRNLSTPVGQEPETIVETPLWVLYVSDSDDAPWTRRGAVGLALAVLLDLARF